MKNRNFNKKVGIISILTGMIANLSGKKQDWSNGPQLQELIQRKNLLLTNGYTGPILRSPKNQRQKRKQIRQMNGRGSK